MSVQCFCYMFHVTALSSFFELQRNCVAVWATFHTNVYKQCRFAGRLQWDFIGVQCESKKFPRLRFCDIFPKRLGIFRPNFTNILLVSIYSGLQIFIQLSAILTKLCYIKCDHPVHTICSKCLQSAETHAGIFWHCFKIVGNFWSKFYTFITRSYLC